MNLQQLNSLTAFAESMGMTGEPFTKVMDLWLRAEDLASLCWCCDFPTIYPIIEELPLSDWKRIKLINYITSEAIRLDESYCSQQHDTTKEVTESYED